MNHRSLLEATARPLGGAEPRPYFVEAKDDTRLFVQDWGRGQPILFLSAWTFNSDQWGSQIAALCPKGFRCVAPDRRGHGRSEVPSHGYTLDVLTDDLVAVIERLDLRDVVLVAYSMGAIEAVSYLARHGSERIAKLVLVAPTTPYLVKTEGNPDGVPQAAIEAQIEEIARDYPKWLADNEAPFFTPQTSPLLRDWIMTTMLNVPLPVALACRETIAAADLRIATSRIDRPTLVIQGDKDASAPLPITGVKTARLIEGSKLVIVEDAPHGLPLTHRERFLDEVTTFIDA